MYAAIFSDKNTYECQVKRLMKRTSNLADLYDEKGALLAQQGCADSINLQSLANSANSIRDSQDLSNLNPVVNQLKAQNGFANCKLW